MVGWAADQSRQIPPFGFAIFVGESCVGFVKPQDRPDVADFFKNPKMTKTGLFIKIPLSMLRGKSFSDFRGMAMTEDGLVGELSKSVAKQGQNKGIWLPD